MINVHDRIFANLSWQVNVAGRLSHRVGGLITEYACTVCLRASVLIAFTPCRPVAILAP